MSQKIHVMKYNDFLVINLLPKCATWACLVEHEADMTTGIEER